MDSKVDLYMDRANTEIDAAEILFSISRSKDKKKQFDLLEDRTFYSGSITHSYYAIFYAAKAILLTKQVTTDSPHVHNKTLNSFKEHFVDSGVLDVFLLQLYKQAVIRADTLLRIFDTEKNKRGKFTYRTLPQANIKPAQQSIDNAKKFVRHVRAYMETP